MRELRRSDPFWFLALALLRYAIGYRVQGRCKAEPLLLQASGLAFSLFEAPFANPTSSPTLVLLNYILL